MLTADSPRLARRAQTDPIDWHSIAESLNELPRDPTSSYHVTYCTGCIRGGGRSRLSSGNVDRVVTPV